VNAVVPCAATRPAPVNNAITTRKQHRNAFIKKYPQPLIAIFLRIAHWECN
jgi:hypothetical protein